MSEIEEMRLDGTALGGSLAVLFGSDVTAALRTCDSCYATWPLGRHVAYVQAAGAVLRCPGCDAVALTLVEGPEHMTLTLRGSLRVPRP